MILKIYIADINFLFTFDMTERNENYFNIYALVVALFNNRVVNNVCIKK